MKQMPFSALLLALALLSAAGCGSSRKAVLQGQEALKQGNYKLAIKQFERATRRIADDPALYYNLATARFHQGELDAAQEAVDVALQLAPDNRNAVELAGEIALNRQNWPLARDLFTRAGQGLPASARLLTALSTVERGAGRDDVARVRLLQAMRTDRKYAPAYYDLASLYRDRYNLKEDALELFEMYLRLTTGSTDVHIEKAKNSITRLKMVLERTPPPPAQRAPAPAVARLLQEGDRLRTAQQWPKAEKAYRDALVADPACFAAAYGIANACRARGDKTAALKAFLKAIEIAPGNMDPFYQATMLAFELRNYAEAGRLADKLLASWPSHAPSYALMASIRSAEGRPLDARAYGEYYVMVLPAGAQRDRYTAWLNTLPRN
jgi:tetratricopeptide (TPR) repeat protein